MDIPAVIDSLKVAQESLRVHQSPDKDRHISNLQELVVSAERLVLQEQRKVLKCKHCGGEITEIKFKDPVVDKEYIHINNNQWCVPIRNKAEPA